MLNNSSTPTMGFKTMASTHTQEDGRSSSAATPTPNDRPASKWAALVDDQHLPTPERRVKVSVLKAQAGIPKDLALLRDVSPAEDVLLRDDDLVDLAEGNVFYSRKGCFESSSAPCTGKPKLAWFVDDHHEVSLLAEQTGNSIRELFSLKHYQCLLRDYDSPNDPPITEDERIRFEDGPVFVTCVEIEKCCKDGESPPPCRGYLIRVDDTKIIVRKPNPTGREILILAGKDPNSTMLNQKIGKRFEPVPLDKKVDLTACGIERFTTLPNEQSEGRPILTRAFALPEEDQELLDGSDLEWGTVMDGTNLWLIIHKVPLPAAFIQRPTSVAIQIQRGYPSAQLDMAYFHPPVERVDRKTIPATEAMVSIQGTTWQRWSRHYTSKNPWKAGVYNTFTHYLLSLSWLERESKKS